MMTDLPSAGRELDALIAEKVMGWRIDYDSAHHWMECGTSVDDLIFTAPGSIFHGEQRISDVPHYSTDIAAAWLIVEKLRLDGRYLQMNDTMGAYRAQFYTLTDTMTNHPAMMLDGAYYQFGDTASHAISLASLRPLNPKKPLSGRDRVAPFPRSH
jgi:hypothetical protein